MGTIKLFEIPIYALSEKKLKEKVHQKEENLREKIKDEKAFQYIRESSILPFGSWEYNHLVGIIKISVKNSSIIYEVYGQTPWVKRYYWYTSKRKAIQNRQIIGTHFYIGDERSNENIQNKVADYLLYSIVRDYIPSNYYVDTEAFLNVNKYIDYLDLVEKMAVC